MVAVAIETRNVSERLEENRRIISEEVGGNVSFDILFKDLHFRGQKAFFFAVDGFVKDDVLLRIAEDLIYSREEQFRNRDVFEVIEKERVGYIETESVDKIQEAIEQVMGGVVALFVEGETQALLLDVRTYPARGPQEPELEKVIRGPRDGFTETLVFNTALIRRRVRDPKLRNELVTVGSRSKTDVAIMYIDDIANNALVAEVRRRLQAIEIDGLPMAEKSVGEFLHDKGWWNPFPSVRFTERPDIAATHLFEGHIVVVVDTSPGVLLLPVTFFHQLQHAEDFHESVVSGTVLRIIRFLGLAAAWFLVPVWLTLALQPELLPEGLAFIGPNEVGEIPLGVQMIIATLGFQLILLGLVHTPTALATSLGIIGAVLLGDLAVQVGLFVNEVILYVIIAALGSFVIPNFDLRTAIRVSNIFLIVMVVLFKLPGLIIGLLLNGLLLVSNHSLGVSYLWPLIPLDVGALFQVLVRHPIPARYKRPAFLNPEDPDK